jgi:hypothetical protein
VPGAKFLDKFLSINRFVSFVVNLWRRAANHMPHKGGWGRGVPGRTALEFPAGVDPRSGAAEADSTGQVSAGDAPPLPGLRVYVRPGDPTGVHYGGVKNDRDS